MSGEASSVYLEVYVSYTLSSTTEITLYLYDSTQGSCLILLTMSQLAQTVH